MINSIGFHPQFGRVASLHRVIVLPKMVATRIFTGNEGKQVPF